MTALSHGGAVARRRLGAVARYVAVSVLTVVALFPFAWMVITALKPDDEIRTFPIVWWPRHPTFEHFATIFREHDLLTMLRNSLVVATTTAVISTVIALLAAYGLSRLLRGSATVVTLAILAAQMLPTVLLVVPYFIMLRSAKLLDTLVALVLTNVSFALPICTWLLRRFVQKVPVELDEAALVDGCSRLGALARIVTPAARSGIAAAFIYTFLVSWHEYLFALSLTSSRENRVITVGIASLIGQYGVSWGELMAMGIVAIVPLVVAFLLVEKHLVEGLAGGVKG